MSARNFKLSQNATSSRPYNGLAAFRHAGASPKPLDSLYPQRGERLARDELQQVPFRLVIVLAESSRSPAFGTKNAPQK
jgi:hypothetical protein